MLLLKLWCRLQKRDKVHDTLCSMFLSIFFFQFLSRPTTFAKRSGIQLGTESHRAWFSVLTSHFTTTLPASLANLSALWAASEMLTTLSANRAVKSNAPVSSFFFVSWGWDPIFSKNERTDKKYGKPQLRSQCLLLSVPWKERILGTRLRKRLLDKIPCGRMPSNTQNSSNFTFINSHSSLVWTRLLFCFNETIFLFFYSYSCCPVTRSTTAHYRR